MRYNYRHFYSVLAVLLSLSGHGVAFGNAIVDQDNLPTQANTAYAVVQGGIHAQIVRAGQTGYLTQVDISLAKSAGLEGELFFQVLGLDAFGHPNELDILTHRIIDVDPIPDDPGLFTLVTPTSFDLTDELLWMNAGQEFAVVISRFAPGTTPWLTYRTTTGAEAYPDGTLYTRGSGDDEPWVIKSSSNDMAFRTWVDSDPTLFGQHTVEVQPAFDAQATRQPLTVGWVISDGDNGIVVGDFGEAYEEERAIMEFELPRLPEGAIVTGARLRFDMYYSSGYPDIAIHPYMGNGTADPSDAEQFSLPYYSTGPITGSDSPIVELGPDAVQSAYDNSLDYIGFMLRGDTYFDAGGFTTLERNLWSIGSGGDLPALLIDYEVPNILGDLDGDGFVGITDLNLVLGAWNQAVPPGNPLADPSGDGFVGIEDLNIVLGNWNAGTPPGEALANIPEPTTITLLGSAGLLWMRRRSA